MEYATAPWKIVTTPEVLLTVARSAWRYLTDEMDPEHDYLVLSWSSDTGWMVGVLPRGFPGDSGSGVKARLDDYTVLVPQRELLQHLHGRKLTYDAGVLSIV